MNPMVGSCQGIAYSLGRISNRRQGGLSGCSLRLAVEVNCVDLNTTSWPIYHQHTACVVPVTFGKTFQTMLL